MSWWTRRKERRDMRRLEHELRHEDSVRVLAASQADRERLERRLQQDRQRLMMLTEQTKLLERGVGPDGLAGGR